MWKAAFVSMLMLAVVALIVSGAMSQPQDDIRSTDPPERSAEPEEVLEVRVDTSGWYRDPLAVELGTYLLSPEGERRQQLRNELQKRRAEFRKRLTKLEEQEVVAAEEFGHDVELRRLLREYFGQQEIDRIIMQLEEIDWRYPRSRAAEQAKEAIQALKSAGR